jgi:putative ABC transport system permease protein
MFASIRAFVWKLLRLGDRSDSESSLNAELQFHLEMEIEANIRQGLNEKEARRRALISFGGIEQIREEYRETRKIRWFDELRQDLSYGLRSLKHNPGFAALATFTLGAALAASALMFSIINGVLLLPLPYKDADRLIRIYASSNTSKKDDVTAADFIGLKRQNRSFEGMAAVESKSFVTLTDWELPELIEVMAVSADFFSVMGGRASIGRLLQAQDCDLRRKYQDNLYDGSVAVLSYSFWQSRYGGDKNVIGQTVRMNGKPVLVIGVTAPEFQFSDRAQLGIPACWMPRVFNESETSTYVMTIGRIRKGTDTKQAQAEMDVIASGLSRADRERNGSPKGIRLVSLHESVVGNVRPRLLVLCGAVTFVLLIACSNMANLLLVRAASRQKEMAVRTSLGASRQRLLRQLLTESVLLCLLGGSVGILVAIFSERAVIAMAPADLPRVETIAVDLRTFGFTFLVAVLAGVLCGIVPALRASGTNVTSSLKQGTPCHLHGRSWLGDSLITGQIAMALVLLIASGLMLRTYIRLQAVPLNFDAKNILILNATPPYFKPEYANIGLAGRVKYSETLLTQIRKIAGVECAAMGELPIPTKILRFAFYGGTPQLYPEGQETKNLMFNAIATSPDYFKVIRARLLAGRLPGSDDRPDTMPSAVVNETFAHKIWPDAGPIGKRLILKRSGMTESIEVIGLVADTRTAGLENGPVPVVYMPLSHNPGNFSGTMLVRCTIDPLTVVPALRKALIAVDKDAALGKIELLEEVLDGHYAARRFNLFIISLFGVLAFSLAVIGIFGTVAHSVARRTHEIGIRMALGAQRGSVLALIVRQGLYILLAGEIVGLAGALALNKLLSSMVFDIATTDSTTYLVVSMTWAVIVLFACFLPAFRATKIDPLVALRCE